MSLCIIHTVHHFFFKCHCIILPEPLHGASFFTWGKLSEGLNPAWLTQTFCPRVLSVRWRPVIFSFERQSHWDSVYMSIEAFWMQGAAFTLCKQCQDITVLFSFCIDNGSCVCFVLSIWVFQLLKGCQVHIMMSYSNDLWCTLSCF